MSNNNRREVLFRARTDGQLIQVDRQNNLLSLQFHDDLVESRIDLRNPAVLPLKENRQMLSTLMFGRTPEKVLLVGCGGGSLARWFQHHLPDTGGLAIEQSNTVIRIAQRYFQFPPQQQGWLIRQAEAAQCLHIMQETFDLIIVDLEINGQTPDWVSSNQFLSNCRARLNEKGAININLIANNRERFARQLWPIRQAFSGLTYCHGGNGDNVFVSAFKQRPHTGNLERRAAQAEKRFGIEFSLFYQELIRDNPRNSGIF